VDFSAEFGSSVEVRGLTASLDDAGHLLLDCAVPWDASIVSLRASEIATVSISYAKNGPTY